MDRQRSNRRRKTVIGCLAFIAGFIALEMGERARLQRIADRSFVTSTLTSTGAPLSKRPASFYFLTAPFTIYQLAPDQQFEQCRLNRHGYRAPEFGVRKAEETLRAIITGGSAGFGLSMFHDDKMFDRLVERSLIDETKRSAEVFNASIPGYNSEQELALFVHDLLRFDPDLLVNFTGWNDFYHPHYNAANRPERPYAYQEFESLMVRGAFETLIAQSMAVRALQGRLRHLASRLGRKPDIVEWRYFPAAVDHFRHNMSTFAALCEGLAIEHIIVLQPEASRKRALCEPERAALDQAGPQYGPAVQQAYEGFRRTAEEVAARFPRTRFIDLSGMFDDTKECVWIDFVHLNERGHEALAARLRAPIAETFARIGRTGTPDGM